MSAQTWTVHEGRPSWHQQRAGGCCAGETIGFASREDAEVFAASIKALRPDECVFVTVGRASEAKRVSR